MRTYRVTEQRHQLWREHSEKRTWGCGSRASRGRPRPSPARVPALALSHTSKGTGSRPSPPIGQVLRETPPVGRAVWYTRACAHACGTRGFACGMGARDCGGAGPKPAGRAGGRPGGPGRSRRLERRRNPLCAGDPSLLPHAVRPADGTRPTPTGEGGLLHSASTGLTGTLVRTRHHSVT